MNLHLLGSLMVAMITAGSLAANRALAVPEFFALTNFSSFQVTTNPASGLIALESPVRTTAAPWNELLLSWNATTPNESGCEFQAQAVFEDHTSTFYGLGVWSEQTNQFTRHSLGKQKDLDGEVDTDLLRLAGSAAGFRVRVILHPTQSGKRPLLRLLTVSLINTRSEIPPGTHAAGLRNKTLEVPQRSQHAYAGGRSWCSPTAVSMVLQYWAQRLGRPELRVDVPEVASGVFDPGWNGTGNWPFNMAFAGRSAALYSYVARLGDLRDVEQLIARDIPVVISVSLNEVRGRPAQEGDGHLIVVTGFNAEGDVWVNDPDATHPPAAGKPIRRLYPRGAVERAWAVSHRTAYVIQERRLPLNWKPLP